MQKAMPGLNGEQPYSNGRVRRKVKGESESEWSAVLAVAVLYVGELPAGPLPVLALGLAVFAYRRRRQNRA